MTRFRVFSFSLILCPPAQPVCGTFRRCDAQEPQPVAPLVAPDGVEVVPDQYIVVYKEDVLRFETSFKTQSRVERAGGRMLHYYSNILPVYSAVLPPEALEAVRSEGHDEAGWRLTLDMARTDAEKLLSQPGGDALRVLLPAVEVEQWEA